MVNSIPAGSRILNEDLAPWSTQINQNTAPGWTTFTPTWTATTTNPVIGNGSLTGKYRRAANADIAHFWIKLVAGSTTTFGSGIWRFGIGAMPALSASAKLWCSPQGWVRDASSTACYSICARWDASSNTFIASEEGSLLTPATPFAWANTDELALNGWYEPA